MPIYKLYPLAHPQDPGWDLAMNHGEVLVRAKSSGDARLVAAQAEAASADRHNENDDIFSIRSSAFTDDKLYGVQQISDGGLNPEGKRGVIEGHVLTA